MFCMPISIRGAVTGVVQMINKIGGEGVFTKVDISISVFIFFYIEFLFQEDEETMEQFVARMQFFMLVSTFNITILILLHCCIKVIYYLFILIWVQIL